MRKYSATKTFHELVYLHYICGSTSKRVTSGGAHFRGLAPGQLNKKRGSVDDTLSDLTNQGIVARPSVAIAVCLTIELRGQQKQDMARMHAVTPSGT